jgi:hypothetical protein
MSISEQSDINTLLDVAMESRRAELVVLRAKCSEAEKAANEAKRAAYNEIAILKAKCRKVEELVKTARQAVSDKEREINELWSEIDSLIEVP